MTVIVEVLVPSWFTAAPWFPSLDVDDAIAIYEDRGINFTERIEGGTWAGQSRSYHVYPQRPGTFEIAAVPVRVRYSSPTTGPRTRATVSPPPVRFEAVVPPGARDLPYFISTKSLEIESTFDREPATLKVGEAFTRTITITVDDALSMVIPPLPSDPMPGLAVYADPPHITDSGGERGERIAGTRVERTTYVAERVGEYRLPQVELVWWDVDAQQLRTSAIPALEFRVEPNPDLAAEIPLPPDEAATEAEGETEARVSLVELLRRWGVPVAVTALALLLASRLWRRFGPTARRWLADRRRMRQESETACFARFRRAALSGDPMATWNQWTAWLDLTHQGDGAATIRGFVVAAADPELERQSGALAALLFAGGERAGTGWSARALYRKVAETRRRRLRSRSLKEQALPVSLNRHEDHENE